MKYEIIDCIDAGSEYCPCHLAETGDCLLCSQLCGKTFCDCVKWKGTCIYQEYVWNGKKAKEGRITYTCKIIKKEILEDNLLILSINVTHKLAKDLLRPGSFVFLRNPSTEEFYNVPLSVMDVQSEENIIKIALDIKGTKTKKINELNENDDILVKAPFWNGVFGINRVYESKDATSIIIARGIGQAPIIPVMKKLYSNGNKIIVILDKGNYNTNFIDEYLQMCSATVIECNTFFNGDITQELKEILDKLLATENVNLIHCAGPDILIYKTMQFLNDRATFSCCNNAKMCCGEGVCGACTTRFKGHRVKRLCKIQTDPKYIFEGRRLI